MVPFLFTIIKRNPRIQLRDVCVRSPRRDRGEANSKRKWIRAKNKTPQWQPRPLPPRPSHTCMRSLRSHDGGDTEAQFLGEGLIMNVISPMDGSLAGQVCNIVFNQLRLKTPESKVRFCDLAAEALSELSNVAKPYLTCYRLHSTPPNLSLSPGHPVGAAYRALCHAQAALAEEIQFRLDGAEPRGIDEMLFQQELDARLVRVSFGYLAPGGKAIQWEEDVRKDECAPFVIQLRLEKFGGRYTLQVADTVSFTGSLVTNLSGRHLELQPATQVQSPMPERTSPPLQAAAPGTGTTTGNESASKKNRKAAAATQGGVPMTAEQLIIPKSSYRRNGLAPRCRLATSWGYCRALTFWWMYIRPLRPISRRARKAAKIANILAGLDPTPPVHTRQSETGG
ncbi:hypothetical protein PAPYR_8750 [Paratrimastix pyriformis]|uniref:Uncharacterized protein n=1 Tax=Paratrimastix pyriformis TaxID=342808 RepID=A0ABQ8UA13_9EUKA|nr:hypothetical protein PAPYR_8750 [Paratrimastix pyriformis]